MAREDGTHRLARSRSCDHTLQDLRLSCAKGGRLCDAPRAGFGEGNGTPLQYSCLENPMDGGACRPWGRKESDTTEQLHFHFSLSCTGEGNGNPLPCSCLENPRDGGAWSAADHGVAQSRTRLKRLSSSSSSNILILYSIYHSHKIEVFKIYVTITRV